MNSKTLKLTYNNFCNNCGKTGHLLAECKNPITSVGIISFRYNTINNYLEYLLIQRNDSFGFVLPCFRAQKQPILLLFSLIWVSFCPL